MSASTFRVTLLIAAVFALSPQSGYAQHAPGVPGELFSDNYDLQLFEPFDLDLDNVRSRGRAGYSFVYDRLYWAPTSERVTIGAPGQTGLSEDIFRQTLLSDGIAPGQFTVINSIQDAPPQSEFGWGDRYTFGYTDNSGNSVSIGILDGPTSVSEQVFGFDPVAVDAAGNVTQATPFGFGSVFVNFASSDPFLTPAELLTGVRDFGTGADGDGDGAVDGEGLVEVIVVGPGGEGAGAGDGESDNLDGDLTGLVFFIPDTLDTDMDGDTTEAIAFGFDFDDLTVFNIRFEQLTVRSVIETQGVELMRSFQVGNRNRFRRKQNNFLELAYGVRLFRLKDDFLFSGNTDLFGETFASTDADNQLIGPQVRANWVRHRGPWTFGVDTRFLAALNVQDIGLVGGIGEEALPGGLNNSAVLQPTFTAVGRQDVNFSPLVEFRLDTSYQISQAVALRMGYTATFIDNITRASDVTGFTIPNLTLRGSGEGSILYHGLSFGVESRF